MSEATINALRGQARRIFFESAPATQLAVIAEIVADILRPLDDFERAAVWLKLGDAIMTRLEASTATDEGIVSRETS
jgi:hypothetical protein